MSRENFKMKYSIFILLLLPVLTCAQRMPEENYLQGLAYYQQQKYDSALISFTISKGLDEKDPNAWYYSGLCYYQKGNIPQAIRNLQQAEKLKPAMASLMLAKNYARQDNLEKTLEYLDIHLRSIYKEPESTILLDKDLRRLDDRKEWTEFWKNNNYYSAFDETMAEATYMAKTDDYLDAIQVLSDGIKRGFRSSPLFAKRAEIYIEMDNEDLALRDLNDALDNDRRNADLYSLRGNVNYKLKNYRQAVEDYNEALKYAPEKFSVYLQRARALNKTGMYEDAREDMRYYLEYFPEDDEAWFIYGKINNEAGKYLNAMRCLNKALELDNTDSRYYLARGESYYNAKTYKYAGNDLSMALDLDPRNPDAYFLKGLTSVQLGDNEMACFCFEKAYEFGKREAFNYLGKYCGE